MPDTTPVTLIPGTLPYANVCYPPNPQELNVAIVTRIQAFLDETFPGVYVGETAPPANQQNRIWFNTLSSRWYAYVNGDWMRVYEFPASSKVELIWSGSEAELSTYAGGSIGAVGIATGPLWEIDHEIDGRVLVGAGTVPGTSPAVTIAQGEVKDSNNLEGSYQVTLIPENVQHFHGCGTDGGTDDPPTMLSRAWNSIKNFTRRINDLNTTGASGWHDDTTALSNGIMGTTEPYVDSNFPTSTPHVNMPQYRARYLAKRTARIWVTAPY